MARHTSHKSPKVETITPQLNSEKMMAGLHKLLEERGIEDADQLKAVLEEASRGGIDQLFGAYEPDTDEDRAQDLAWSAMDAESPREAQHLFEAALKFDPECVDALVMQALTLDGEAAVLSQLERAVAAGAKKLGGEKFFAENKGHFWGIVETRPYMRARMALAKELSEAGHTLDAIAHYEELLELCPNDNGGNRDPLLALYLRAGETHRAGELMKKYEEASACFAYGRFIHAVLTADEDDDVRAAFRSAYAANPHVADHLIREKQLPEFEGMHGFGDETEAAYCLTMMFDALVSHPAIMGAMIELYKAKPSRTPNTSFFKRGRKN
jgi:tetratricopeptide (TPR) repeat protein